MDQSSAPGWVQERGVPGQVPSLDNREFIYLFTVSIQLYQLCYLDINRNTIVMFELNRSIVRHLNIPPVWYNFEMRV